MMVSTRSTMGGRRVTITEPSPRNAVSVRGSRSVGSSRSSSASSSLTGLVQDMAINAAQNAAEMAGRAAYNRINDYWRQRNSQPVSQAELDMAANPIQGGYDAVRNDGGAQIPVNSVQVPPFERGDLPSGSPFVPNARALLRDKGVQANWRQIMRDTRTYSRGARAARPLDYKELSAGNCVITLLLCGC